MQGALGDLVDAGEFVDEAAGERLAGFDHGAGDQQPFGAVGTHHATQCQLDRLGHDQPHLHFVEADPVRAFGHHAVVAEQRQHGAAGGAVAGDRGDQRDRCARQGAAQREELPPVLEYALAVALEQGGHVHAGGKQTRCAGQHDAAHAFAHAVVDCLAQRLQQFQVQRVDGRTRQLDLADRVVMGGEVEHGVLRPDYCGCSSAVQL